MFLVLSGRKGPIIGIVAEWDDARILQTQDPEARIICLSTVMAWDDIHVVSAYANKIHAHCRASIDVHLELRAANNKDLNG